VFGDFSEAPVEVREKMSYREIRCARHHFDPPGTCMCKYINPQWITHDLPDKEILAFGGKGSIKTEGTFGSVIGGSPPGNCCPKKGKKGHDRLGKRGEIIPVEGTRCLWCACDISYINHPKYDFLILRRTTRDLENWFRRARQIYGPMGAQFSIDPPKVVFPGGATGLLGHMDTDDAYEKWWGQEFVRIFFEEIQQCPNEKLYNNIKLSCRTSQKELMPQIFATANPGGAGNQWVRRKWWDIPGRPPADVIANVKKQLRDEAGPLMIRKRNPHSGTSTIVVHSTVYDNPYMCTYKDGKRDATAIDYARDLEAEPSEKRRRQLLWGDPYCFEGAYFDLRERPLPDEPPHAFHIVPSRPAEDPTDTREVVDENTLEGWWPRAIGLDWGRAHRAAAMWGCWHPSGRLYIYRELSIAGLSPMQIGAELAKRSLPDFKKSTSPHIPVYASHDAFWRRDDASNTFAHQIKAGIDTVLGDQAAFVLMPTEEEMALPVRQQWQAVKERQRSRQPATIMTITRASNDRVPGWNLIQDLLRWNSILPEKQEVSERHALNLRREFGDRIEAEYRLSCEQREEEVLPRMRITDACPALRRSLQSLVHDEKKPEDVLKVSGDDEADALRYLVVEFPFREGCVPRETEILAMADAHFHPSMSAEGRIQIMRKMEGDYDRKNKPTSGVTLARKSGRRARLGLQARLRESERVAGGVR